MKIGDLVYPFVDSGDYTIGIYLGREFVDWKFQRYGSMVIPTPYPSIN
jgi:hypothetical protein